MLTATVWYDRLDGVWYIKLSDGRMDKLPAKATTADLYDACKKLGVRAEHVQIQRG